ncbi:hypothetical protein H9N25_00770 [Pedobacter riviphilus]|uniref:Four helix bundle protein n=1 Tax=Pedobacter riviphilus TaxID=2766984 RepID=A0ABX6TJK3_9SPHI|nr:hypothetical protein [Pedobacter riviphilus]QNR85076.1 hypothetical protein H9N25_00770 [Pedobacter riviphilus]
MKGKRIDLYYQSKLPAFKELSIALANYKNYCLGKTAFYEGNEFSPFMEAQGGTLEHRGLIAQTASINSMYFSLKSRLAVEELLNQMSGLCNAELYIAQGQDVGNLKDDYFEMSQAAERCIDGLYKELKLG